MLLVKDLIIYSSLTINASYLENLFVWLYLYSSIVIRNEKIFWKHGPYCSQQTFVGLEDVLKTCSKHVLKTSSTRLQRNNFTSSKTSWKTKNCYAEDVLKTCLEDVLKTYLEDILDTCLEDVLKTCFKDVLNTCLEILWRQTKYLLGISVY